MTDWHELEHKHRDAQRNIANVAQRHDVKMYNAIQEYARAVEALARARFFDHVEQMPQVFS